MIPCTTCRRPVENFMAQFAGKYPDYVGHCSHCLQDRLNADVIRYNGQAEKWLRVAGACLGFAVLCQVGAVLSQAVA